MAERPRCWSHVGSFVMAMAARQAWLLGENLE